MRQFDDSGAIATHLVYMTVGSQSEALEIAGVVVKERLAACANVFPKVTSIYEWEGALQEDEESVVIFKTHASRIESLKSRLVQLHSYDCPCVVSVPIVTGHSEFLEWVQSQTRSKL